MVLMNEKRKQKFESKIAKFNHIRSVLLEQSEQTGIYALRSITKKERRDFYHFVNVIKRSIARCDMNALKILDLKKVEFWYVNKFLYILRNVRNVELMHYIKINYDLSDEQKIRIFSYALIDGHMSVQKINRLYYILEMPPIDDTTLNLFLHTTKGSRFTRGSRWRIYQWFINYFRTRVNLENHSKFHAAVKDYDEYQEKKMKILMKKYGLVSSHEIVMKTVYSWYTYSIQFIKSVLRFIFLY
jgi:hypothetical protein